MSTKSTIAYGDREETGYSFHLYNECYDDENVYLEINHGHAIEIPMAVWESIRTFPGMSFDLADKSNAEIRKMVEEQVDERIAQIKAARKIKSEKRRKSAIAWANLAGGFLFGNATSSRQQQILNGIREYSRRRKFQRKVRSEARSIVAVQTKGPYLINLNTGETKALGEADNARS
jgi:hypothetical protein